MAGRTRQSTTEEKPGYEVPPPMEEGDPRSVPQVGGDPDNPESVESADDNPKEDETPENAPFGFERDVTDGWEHTEDGGVRPTDIPWAGY